MFSGFEITNCTAPYEMVRLARSLATNFRREIEEFDRALQASQESSRLRAFLEPRRDARVPPVRQMYARCHTPRATARSGLPAKFSTYQGAF